MNTHKSKKSKKSRNPYLRHSDRASVPLLACFLINPRRLLPTATPILHTPQAPLRAPILPLPSAFPLMLRSTFEETVAAFQSCTAALSKAALALSWCAI